MQRCGLREKWIICAEEGRESWVQRRVRLRGTKGERSTWGNIQGRYFPKATGWEKERR